MGGAVGARATITYITVIPYLNLHADREKFMVDIVGRFRSFFVVILFPESNSTNTLCEVWQKSNETDFLFTKVFISSNIDVIPFKIVPLGSYTPMETFFPLLIAALEVFNRYGLQHVRYTLLDVFFIKTSLKGSEKGSFA